MSDNPPRNVKAENRWLRDMLALRREFQRFIDANQTRTAVLTEEFTLDGAAFYKVTPDQKATLMVMAPDDVKKLNGAR